MIPKAFVTIGNRSLLSRVLQTIAGIEGVEEVVIAVPAGEKKTARAQANSAGLRIPMKVTEGGATRQDSVRRALALTSAEAELIVVHDAARPFATAAMFSACLTAASQSGAAVAAIPVTDTLKQVENGTIVATIPRAGLWQAQTPQAFRRELLVRAHEAAANEQIEATDDAHLCAGLGLAVQVVQGSALNFKITTRDDLRTGESIAGFVTLR